MILRLLKAVFKISLLFACAIGLAYGFNVAMDTLLVSELQIYDVAFVIPVETEIGYLLMRGVFYMFYDTTARYVVILMLVLVPYCMISLNTANENGHIIKYGVLGKIKEGIGKIISFEKPDWFWGLCLITGFTPILVPFVIWLVLVLIYDILVVLISPVIYVITQLVYAVKGSVS